MGSVSLTVKISSFCCSNLVKQRDNSVQLTPSHEGVGPVLPLKQPLLVFVFGLSASSLCRIQGHELQHERGSKEIGFHVNFYHRTIITASGRWFQDGDISEVVLFGRGLQRSLL